MYSECQCRKFQLLYTVVVMIYDTQTWVMQYNLLSLSSFSNNTKKMNSKIHVYEKLKSVHVHVKDINNNNCMRNVQ